MTNDNTSAAQSCNHCNGPIPEGQINPSKYCHLNCARKAAYHRKTPAQRAEINARSNRRRFEKDLLPHIRSISKATETIEPNTPIARWVVVCLLAERMRAWKLNLAMNYSQVQDALAELAGGYDRLEELEDLTFAVVCKHMEEEAAA